MSAAKMLRLSLELLLALLLGTSIANALLIAYAWQKGGSTDPRCAIGWKGYVEVYQLDYTPPRVSCVYEPQVGAP